MPHLVSGINSVSTSRNDRIAYMYVTFQNKIRVLYVCYRKNNVRVRYGYVREIAVVEELRFPSTSHI